MSEDAKKMAARAALAELPEHGTIGLGTGSTVRWFLEAIAEEVRGGRRLIGVCTSEATRAHATTLGMPLLGDEAPWGEGETPIDVTVDGADEVSDALDLSKGAGGALTREKIVAFASRRLVIVCDAQKRVRRLGQSRPVAVEILPFGREATLRSLDRFGTARLRTDSVGGLARTDGGNFLVDLATGPMDQPGDLDGALRELPGVVETGLFLRRADVIFVSDGRNVERLARERLRG